jgi:hypothetical protein
MAAMRRGWVTPMVPTHPAPRGKAQFGQLGGFARTGFAGHDHDRVIADGFNQLLAFGADRQMGVKRQIGRLFEALPAQLQRPLDALGQIIAAGLQLPGVAFLLKGLAQPAQLVVCGHTVHIQRSGQLIGDGLNMFEC